MKVKRFKWYVYLLMAIIIIVGIICSAELVKLFNVNSQEVGTAITTEQNKQADYRYDLGEIILENVDGNNFSMTYNLGAETFNGTDSEFIVEINGEPTTNLQVNAGSLEFDYILKFKGLNAEELTTSILHMRIEYLTSGTRIKLAMKNTNNSVSFLSSYSTLNGFVVEVYKRS